MTKNDLADRNTWVIFQNGLRLKLMQLHWQKHPHCLHPVQTWRLKMLCICVCVCVPASECLFVWGSWPHTVALCETLPMQPGWMDSFYTCVNPGAFLVTRPRLSDPWPPPLTCAGFGREVLFGHHVLRAKAKVGQLKSRFDPYFQHVIYYKWNTGMLHVDFVQIIK